jgi:hypothetical protein
LRDPEGDVPSAGMTDEMDGTRVERGCPAFDNAMSYPFAGKDGMALLQARVSS